MKITYGTASASEIDAYYGERPSETIKAIIIRLDGMPAGVIGLARQQGSARAFSEYKPELEPFLKSIAVARAIKAAQKMFASYALPIYAIREGCAGILERVGFVQHSDEVYRWHS
jgi:hypothetical protein